LFLREERSNISPVFKEASLQKAFFADV